MNIWTHPGTGETRIYLNGEFRDRHYKLWIEQEKRGPVDFVIKQRGFRGGMDEACEAALHFLRYRGIELHLTNWAELVAAAA